MRWALCLVDEVSGSAGAAASGHYYSGWALYWVTDSVYQAMFLTIRDGVVLVDAPPTIGHSHP